MKRYRDDAESRGHGLEPSRSEPPGHDAETVLGQVSRRAPLPAPTVTECARLIDSAAGDPERTRVLAALLQRAAMADPDLGAMVSSLASLAADAGCLAPGHVCQALAAEADLARLLETASWDEVAAVLGEDHTPHDHLVSLALTRLQRHEGDAALLEGVIRRLESDAARLAATGAEIRNRPRRRPSDRDLEILIQVLEVAAVEVAIIRRGLESISAQMKLGRFPEP